MTFDHRAFLLCVLSAAILGCHKKTEDEGEGKDGEPVVEVRCVAAAKTTLERTVALRGRLATRPGGELGVAALPMLFDGVQLAGKVVEVKVKEGDLVAKGAVVATLDNLAPLAGAKQADAAFAHATTAVVQADIVLDRTRALLSQGLAAKADLDAAQATADAARADLESQRAAKKFASGTLGRTDVRSSFAGVVTKVWRGPGAIVDGTAATPIIELAATDALELVADATVRDLSLVADGAPAEIEFPGAKFTGHVIAVSKALDPATGLGSVRVQILAPVGDEHATLPPLGAFGRLSVDAGKKEGALVLPKEALRGALADGAEIAICDGDHARLARIVPGYRDATRVEVLEGLKDGDLVAIDHVLGLEDGTKITRVAGSLDEEKHEDAGVKGDPP